MGQPFQAATGFRAGLRAIRHAVCLPLFAVLLSTTPAQSQLPYTTTLEPGLNDQEIPANRGSAALWQSLLKLRTRASLMMITAHPDDEDGGTLAYESRHQGTRVSLLTLNRGEGGANVMSRGYFDALGLVRTMELLAAGRYYGVEQYWTSVIDYGFSKTKAESIGKWTHGRVLYDVVRTVRQVRPLVITSVFVGGDSDGHGNHQTAGAMAQEVIQAAGDPNVFPDQIQTGLKPWSPLKGYARVPNRRTAAAAFPVNLEIPTGTYDPLLGVSYQQLAREGLGFQKSQNGGTSIPAAGPATSAYHRFVPATGSKDEGFFDGIDISLPGIAAYVGSNRPDFLVTGLMEINAAVENATAKFSATKPEATAPDLATGMNRTIALMQAVESSALDATSKFNIRHELEIKRVQFNNALAEALGLSISASVAAAVESSSPFAQEPETFRAAIPGQQFAVKVHVANQGTSPVSLVSTQLLTAGQKTSWRIKPVQPTAAAPLSSGKALDHRFDVTVPETATSTRPYFTRPDIEQSYYDIPADAGTDINGRPLAPYPLAAWADFTFQGAPIRIGHVVQTIKRVTGPGTVQEPLVVAPALSVAIQPRMGIVPLGSKTFDVAAVVRSSVQGTVKGTLHLDLPAGWTSKPLSVPFSTTNDGQEVAATFSVTPASLGEKPYKIQAVAESGGRRYTEGFETTGYPGLRPYFLYTPSEYKVSGVDVKTAPGLRIAYIMGTGDDVPASMEHLGIKATQLGPSEVASADLAKFDAIVLGIRAYAARGELKTHNTRLLDYVRNGGVLIVQYNTPEFDHNFGPYPYVMGNNPEEVTDEASKISVLVPDNPLFQWPNKITGKDFEGWVEERGSKWMQTWDPRYQALLETHDADQPPQKGGLLYAKYGKGVYIYNAYAFYRQLPEGVPGAYRIFANLLSLPKNPAR